MHPTIFVWQISNFFGWGIYGLNLLLHWPYHAITALPLPHEFARSQREHDVRLRRRINSSLKLHSDWTQFAGRKIVFEGPVFVSLGNRMERTPAVHNIELSGEPTIGVAFVEDTLIERSDVAKLADLKMVISGSSWNTSILSAAGIALVKTILQGVDTNLFRPRPKSDWRPDNFNIFSGGKLEFRKAQDLVLVAFRFFSQRHPDALLVTAWHSPWSVSTAHTFVANPEVPLPPLRPDYSVDVRRWAQTFGIAPEQIVDVGAVPNYEMPKVLRDMDVAVFPNRCEGGTNLVAMECLASGIPTILSANTGHLDPIERTGSLALKRQAPITSKVPGVRATEGWGQSDVEEIVEMMEQAYVERSAMRERAMQGALAMRDLSWKAQIRLLHETVKPVL
jgi:glycosyltransferase involved in cell wall biosynthesis